jgi:hypothetical protein
MPEPEYNDDSYGPRGLPTIDVGTSIVQDRQRRRERAGWPIVAGVASTTLAVMVVGWWLGDAFLSPIAPATPTADRQSDNVRGEEDAATRASAAPVDPPAVRQRELWRSPTAGEPVDLAYLPPGVQAIIAVRAAELWRSPEGERIVETLGPWARALVDDVQRRCGIPLAEVEQLIVGFRDAGSTKSEMIVVVRLAEPRELGEWLAVWPRDGESKIAEQTVYTRDELRLWFPNDDGASDEAPRREAVIAIGDTLQEIIDAGGAAPAVSRQLSALVDQSDADRQLTILGTPSFLEPGARDVMGGEGVALRQLVDLWLRDEVAAYLLSCDANENFFSEIRVYPASGINPDALARRLQAELIASPGRLRDYVERLDLSDYGRRIVMRLPRMVEAWTEFVRYGIKDRQVVFRSYLPAVAAHNLAMGGQIILLEEPSSPAESVVTDDVVVSEKMTSVAERLDRTMSLIVPRESLHSALEMLSEELGVEIEIVGGDLQAEGITKNQAISLDVRQQSGRAILETILRLADSDGRLVFVVDEADGNILVTTRAAAEKRGDTVAGPVAGEIE